MNLNLSDQVTSGKGDFLDPIVVAVTYSSVEVARSKPALSVSWEVTPYQSPEQCAPQSSWA